MRNDKYWQERFAELQKSQMNKGDTFNKRLAEEYQKAIAAISKEIAYWYQRFADNNEINMAAARKMLTAGELKELHWNVDEYMKKALHESQKYAKQLENASAKVHIDRLTALKIQMEMTVNELSEKTAAGLKSTLENIYEEGYYKSAFEIQKGVGFGSAFGVLDKETVAAVVAKPWTADGKNFSKRIWGGQRKQLIKSLENDLTQAIIRGDGPDGVIKKLTDDFGVARNRASTLVMTESAFFAAESSRKSMEALGVQKYKIIGTLDKAACRSCGEKDGKVYDMSEYEIGKTAPPFHPNCRCTTVPYRKSWDGDTRAARDENGKEIKVPADMTYAEWRRQFVDGEKDFSKPLKKSLKSIDNITKLGYTVSPAKEKELAEIYERNVLDGWISPLSGFDNYKKLYGRIENEVIGLKTSNGTVIKSQSEHFLQRVIGTAINPAKVHNGIRTITGTNPQGYRSSARSGVEIEDVIEAVTKGERKKIGVSSNGLKSQRYFGKKCVVTINPDTGNLIQCNPREKGE